MNGTAVSTSSTTIYIHNRGEDYDVLLSADGDHIVTKRDKLSDVHAFTVPSESSTWERVVALAQATGLTS